MDEFEEKNRELLGQLRERTGSELVWHYTDWDALSKISCKDGVWWASRAAFLNDAQELAHGLQLLQERLKTLPYDATKEVVASLEKNIHESETYIISFSGAFDDLSQWRAYGGSELSVSIGVRVEAIEAMRGRPQYQAQYVECLYDDSDKQQEIDKILAPLDTMRQAIEEEERQRREGEIHPGSLPRAGRHYQMGQLITGSHHASQFAARAKHIAFKSENEHRFVVRMGNYGVVGQRTEGIAFGFHPKGRLLVPHICIPRLTDGMVEPIAAVLVGPNPHRPLAISAIKRMMALHGIDAPVAISTTPYRSW